MEHLCISIGCYEMIYIHQQYSHLLTVRNYVFYISTVVLKAFSSFSVCVFCIRLRFQDWLAQTKVITCTLKTQPHAVNARWKRLLQRKFIPFLKSREADYWRTAASSMTRRSRSTRGRPTTSTWSYRKSGSVPSSRPFAGLRIVVKWFYCPSPEAIFLLELHFIFMIMVLRAN